jgi:peptide/nickel transport system substrate-binding protein
VATASLSLVSLAMPITARAATNSPSRGGTLKIAVNSFPTGLSPVSSPIVLENPSYAMEAIYGLLGYEDPQKGAVHLVLLQSITPSDHFLVWDLTLHSGLKFSDGTTFNAAAIEFTLKQLMNPSNAYQYEAQLTGIKMKVISPLTLQITLPTRDSQFAAEMTQEFPFIGSPTAWAREGANFNTHPVGAGAFILKSFVANSSIVLVRNPHYSLNAAEPYVNEVVLNNYPTSQTQLMNALDTGQDNLAWLQGSTAVSQARSAGLKVLNFAESGGAWLETNTQRPPFNNLLAREAIALALSHTGLTSAWAPGSTAMKEVFSPTSPFYDAKYVNPAEDDAMAQTLFNELAAQGDPVNFTITDITGYEGIAQYVQAQLANFQHVSVTINMEAFGPYLTDAVDGNFQMLPGIGIFANPWPTLAQAVEANGPINYGKWNDPKVNAAINILKRTTSPTVEKTEWTIVLKEIHSQYPFFTAQATVLTTAYAKNIHNVICVEQGTLPLLEQIYMS